MKLLIAATTLMLVSLASCREPELERASPINRKSFMGTWYEIASLPVEFNKKCRCSKIDLREDEGDGYVQMIFSCIKKEKQGAVLGKIFYSDPDDFSKWRLQYFWPFRNTLQIVAIDSGYTYAMLAAPKRDHLQILSRNKTLDEATLDMLIKKAEEMGFASEALTYPEQSCD